FIGPKWLCFYNVDVSSIQCTCVLPPIVCSPRLRQFINMHNIKSILVFEDLTNPETKKTAYRTLKPFSGIYLVVNLVNGKYYVGSAVTGNIYMRMLKHLFSLIGSILVANAVKNMVYKNLRF
uniref:GIY-YIG endonuclease n=1 Tax=Pappia fissilis TaxID=1040649 RepID=UPI002A807268